MTALLVLGLLASQAPLTGEAIDEPGPPHEDLFRAAGNIDMWVTCSIKGPAGTRESARLRKQFEPRLSAINKLVSQEFGSEAAERSYIVMPVCQGSRTQRGYARGLDARRKAFVALLHEWEARYRIGAKR